MKVQRPILYLLTVVLIGLTSALGYWMGSSSTPNKITTETTYSTIYNTTTVTTTITVFPPVNATSTISGDKSPVFLGDSKLSIPSLSGRNIIYDYTRFPYSDFTFHNFTFTYREGRCEDASPDKIQILPCGSKLSVTFPSGASAYMLTEANSLERYEHFRLAGTAVTVINGEAETAGLLLVVLEDGSQTVYVYVRGRQ